MERFKFTRVIASAVAVIAASAMLATLVSTASAQDWPSRTIRIRVGFPPGGTTDILARVIAQKLNETLKVPVIVENRGGVVGSLDAASLAHSALDDHIFMMVPPGIQAINQFVYEPVGYDPAKDFVSVGLVAQIPNVLAVNASSPMTTLKDLVDRAKAEPNALNYSNSGIGASGQLLAELLKMKTGIQMTCIPYKGNGPALMALVANEVQVNVDNNPQLLSMIQAGKLRALAVSSSSRWDRLPKVPTFAELGYPDLTMQVWYGLIAQAKMPREIVEKMNKAMNAAIKSPDIVERFHQLNVEPAPSTPEEMDEFVTKERARWKQVVEVAKIKGN